MSPTSAKTSGNQTVHLHVMFIRQSYITLKVADYRCCRCFCDLDRSKITSPMPTTSSDTTGAGIQVDVGQPIEYRLGAIHHLEGSICAGLAASQVMEILALLALCNLPCGTWQSNYRINSPRPLRFGSPSGIPEAYTIGFVGYQILQIIFHSTKCLLNGSQRFCARIMCEWARGRG